jgi:hypothetical protein
MKYPLLRQGDVMKKVIALVGLTSACAACCALPTGTILAAIGATSIGAVTVNWAMGFAVLALGVMGGAVFIRRRSATAKRCASEAGACGCDDACATR